VRLAGGICGQGVGGKVVVEGNIFLKDDDDVFDRSGCVRIHEALRAITGLAGPQSPGGEYGEVRCQRQGEHPTNVLPNHAISFKEWDGCGSEFAWRGARACSPSSSRHGRIRADEIKTRRLLLACYKEKSAWASGRGRRVGSGCQY